MSEGEKGRTDITAYLEKDTLGNHFQITEQELDLSEVRSMDFLPDAFLIGDKDLIINAKRVVKIKFENLELGDGINIISLNRNVEDLI